MHVTRALVGGVTLALLILGVGGCGEWNKHVVGPAVNARTGMANATNCDKFSLFVYDAYIQNGSNGGAAMTSQPAPNQAVHVCSYMIANGSQPQDFGLYLNPNTSVQPQGGNCAGQGQLWYKYHLAAYQVISRGGGVGELYALPAGKSLCIQRLNNAYGPMQFEIDYTIY